MSGGTGAYSFAWSPSVTSTSTSTTTSATGLAVGTYNLVVTDVSLCTATQQYIISGPGMNSCEEKRVQREGAEGAVKGEEKKR